MRWTPDASARSRWCSTLVDEPLGKEEIFDSLARLTALDRPVWLAGGLAADFHVGRWTRDHSDIDLVALTEDRPALSRSLTTAGFAQTHDEEWITRWTTQGRTVGEVSVAFMRRADEDTGDLVITPRGSRNGTIATGIYPGVPGNLRLDRYRTLENLTFRVVSAEDDWVFTNSFSTMHPGSEPGPTDVHNLALLESVLTEADLERLRPLVGRRRSLEEIDAQS